jgi:CheY-like chemotaxis protein
MRIILVEDNPADVFLIEEALRAHEVSFEITWVRDGEQAIALIDRGETNNPELFLLDLNLPRVDGRDVLAKIRRTPGLAKIPVIIMTSSDSPQDGAKPPNSAPHATSKNPQHSTNSSWWERSSGMS